MTRRISVEKTEAPRGATSRNSRFMRAAAMALCLSLLPLGGAQANTLNNGWWVILGSIAAPNNGYTPRVEAGVRRAEAAARRCGLRPFTDFSSKFRGFVPGYAVVVVGAFSSQSGARAVLAQARRCVPDAYVKRGGYAGE